MSGSSHVAMDKTNGLSLEAPREQNQQLQPPPPQQHPGSSGSSGSSDESSHDDGVLTDDSPGIRRGDEERTQEQESRRRLGSERKKRHMLRFKPKQSLKEKVNVQQEDEDHQQEVIRRLMSLNLPNMPSPSQLRNGKDPPTIRILVVADIDLASASALAESALLTYANPTIDESGDDQHETTSGRRDNNPLHQVDLCIACGPFCKEDDLRYEGRQQRNHMIRRYCCAHPSSNGTSSPNNAYQKKGPTQVFLDGDGVAARDGCNSNMSSVDGVPSFYHRSDGPLPPPSQPVFYDDPIVSIMNEEARLQRPMLPNYSLQEYHNASPQSVHATTLPRRFADETLYPYKRSREEAAALEGLVTAAISQLESIVCRVLVLPGGKTDPVTLSVGQGGLGDSTCSEHRNDISIYERRLTPNSRNIHQRWMPIGPGIGIAGLAYLEWQKLLQDQPAMDEEEIDEDEEESETFEDPFQWGTGDVGEMPPLIYHKSTFKSPGQILWEEENPSAALTPEIATKEMELRRRHYGSHFCHQLMELVKSAPPGHAISATPPSLRPQPLIDTMLQTSLFQSILVSQFHHWQPPVDMALAAAEAKSSVIMAVEKEVDSLDRSDQKDEFFDPPWPMEHESFCANPIIQEHVLLEIAAGLNSKGITASPMDVTKGKMRVVLPGSLRERGEFCLVDIAFMKDPSSPTTLNTSAHNNVASTNISTAKPNHSIPTGAYRWMVRRTRFHCLNDFV